MIPHPLEQKLISVRHRLWAVVALGGLSRTIAAAVGLVLLLSLADYLLRPTDLGVRLSASAVALATFCWVAYRTVYRPAVRLPSDVDMARRMERGWPRLGNRFSSAIEFLRQPEDAPEAGSAELRRAVIAQSTDDVESLEAAQVVGFRPAFKPLAWAVALGGIAVVTALSNPPAARTALARLARPWQRIGWPRKHHLCLTNAPTRLAEGQAFEVALIDQRGPLPDEVRIHYRLNEEGRIREMVEPMRREKGSMTARRENVRRPFEYRAEGGDDDTLPWTSLDVVPPPKIELYEVMLYPPSYTGWPPARCQPHIHALVGTRAGIRGRADRPLRRATMQFDDGSLIAARIAGDQRHFVIAADDLVIEKSAAYWFVLEDVDGLQSSQRQRWKIVAETDLPPRVVLQRPQADLYVTPTSTVALRIVVDDDLGIRDVALVGTRSDANDQGALTVPVFTGSPQPPPRPSLPDSGLPGPTNQADFGVAGGRGGHRETIDFVWDVGSLAMPVGSEVVFRVQAHDHRPQVGSSVPSRRIHIVSTEQFDRRLGQREGQLRDDLQQALAQQRDVHSQNEALTRELQQSDTLGQSAMDRLQAAALNQRQIHRQLTSGGGQCVAGQCQSLRDELAYGQADRPVAARRLEALQAALQRLGKDPLPAIDRALTAASKAALAAREETPTSQRRPDSGEFLASAGRNQQEVIAALEKLVNDLSQGLSYDRFRREIAQLRQQQRLLQQAVGQLAPQTLALDFEQLPTAQQTELAGLDRGQVDLAHQLDQVEFEMELASEAAGQRDRSAGARLTDAVATARKLAISARMRETGGNVGRNHLGQAVTEQRHLVEDLTQVIERLTRPESSPPQTPNERASDDNETNRQGKPPAEQPAEPGGGKPGGQAPERASAGDPSKAGQQPGHAPTGATGAPGQHAASGSVSAQELLGEVWGHLPPRARAQITQWSDEQFLPKYEQLIEQYYKSLAEEPPSTRP